MPIRSYTRVRVPGGCYFFTVNLAQRHENDLLVRHIAELRAAFRRTRVDRPFAVEGMVVMPEHLHCIWRLPEGDADFSTRWYLIKSRFSRALAYGEEVTRSRARKGERGVWQRRYWEHLIRDERDYWAHMDYLHFNPVKHGHVAQVREWPHSSFHRWVRQGVYAADWGGNGHEQ
jgi:putative transposase